jgi:alkanesulfonate monooxygenase SsuD/methylene tetrahydromethanopterin reductase-like flavin-dependent oxidoreductase (luciferase family)
MRFGLFGSAQARRGDGDPARGLRDYVDTSVEAEALGFDLSFLVEHHFSGLGQVSASHDLLAWVAARTTTMRLGTAVIVLPWHNPVLLAKRAATLDLMSGGRLEFGVGKGYRHSEFVGFCMPYEEAQARFEEALQVIIRAWTSNVRFSHDGRFWQYEDIIVEPPTSQKPHPPVWIAASKPDSIRSVAARGCKLLLDQFASTETVGERAVRYARPNRCRTRSLARGRCRVRTASRRRVHQAEHPTVLHRDHAGVHSPSLNGQGDADNDRRRQHASRDDRSHR